MFGLDLLNGIMVVFSFTGTDKKIKLSYRGKLRLEYLVTSTNKDDLNCAVSSG